ncbi:T9SS type A sorting domain-containing protein [bacterium]|nr:T9SS type A sorting domain-containing protein [bacterium]
MKRLFPAVALLFCVGLVLLPVAGFAASQQVQAQDLPLQVSQKVILPDGLRFSLSVDEPRWTEVGSSALQIAEFEMAGALAEEGMPMVPRVGRMFRLPATGGVQVEVMDAEYDTYSDVDYAAFFGDEYSNELDRLGAPTRPVDAWYPEIIAEVTEPAIFKDFRVANLVTYPVQVNTARREVRVYRNIDVDLHFVSGDDRNALGHWPTEISENFLPWYRLFLDWSDSELDEYTLYRGNIQVVCRNAAKNTAAMQNWTAWKEQKGWVVEYITEDDVSIGNANSIRAELIDRYEDADPKFDHVVIIGDDSGAYTIPASVSGYGAGDHEYGTLAGTDELIDVTVGRVSVESSTQLTAYVNKVLNYERDPDMDNTGWYQRAAMIVSSNHSGIGTVFTLRYHRRNLVDLGYTEIDTAWVSPYGTSSQGQTHQTAINAFNNGMNFYAARGYIGSGLSIGQIQHLNNHRMNPVVIDLTCATGNWTGGTGISEAYMRGNSTAALSKAAIGAVGLATGGTKPRYNNALHGGGGYAMHILDRPHLGDMYFGAKYNIYINFNGYENNYLDSFNQWFNLMGDPTVWIYTQVPEEMTVVASPAVELGQHSYPVNVEVDGDPVDGAWVTLWKSDDDEEMIARGVTDANGDVILEAPFEYTGEAILTVTRYNAAPYRLTVDVTDPDARLGFVDVTIEDGSEPGTSGNNNGIAESGETVGISFTLKNFGDSQETDIEITASTDDPWLLDISGSNTFASIDPDAEVTADDMILVEISPDAQHDWIIHLDLDIESADNTYSDHFNLTLEAAKFAIQSLNYSTIDPGETEDLSITLRHVGTTAAVTPSVTLMSLDPFLGIQSGTGTLPTMENGDSETIADLEIISHIETIPGRMAPAQLVIESFSGQVDTVHFTLQLGSPSSSDPTGPDRYGYYAFDNTDNDYEMAPSYDWIEINPNEANNDYDGTMLNIHDNSDDDDDAVTVDLPFTVQYYGNEFDLATVSSNGWVAMGGQTDVPNSRNYTIPSPLGPNNMIAPYWDERFVPGNTSSAVYEYWDEENGRYIIEWYNARDYQNNHPCTFQVIFYTQDERPTFTGDTDLLFQYEDITHTMGTSYNSSADTYYWTTGIENGDQTDGILLWYWNDSEPGAPAINDGRAILMTTNVPVLVGTIEGEVTDLETGEAVSDIIVRTDNWVYQTTTNGEGHYMLPEVVVGQHNLVAEGIGYNTSTQSSITVGEDSTTVVDFALAHPEFACDTDEIVETVPIGETVNVPVTITNDGNGPLDFEVMVEFAPLTTARRGPQRIIPANPPAELDDPFDWVYDFELSTTESRNRGLTFDGTYFWVAGSNSSGEPNKLYRYSNTGELLGTFDQPVGDPTSIGFYSLAWDGDYLYGVDSRYLFQMEVSEDAVIAVDSLEVPVPTARYLAYDSMNNWFWMGDISTNVRAIDREGEIVREFAQDFSPRGLGFLPNDPDGYYLYFIARNITEEDNHIIKMDPETGTTITMYSFTTTDPTMLPSGSDITNFWNPLLFTYATVFDGGTEDYVQLWELSRNLEWLQIEPEIATVEAGEDLVMDVTLDNEAMPVGEYNVWLNVHHNAIEQTYELPLTMIVPTDLPGEDESAQPLEWAFDGVYPNPFNPVTNVRFTLKEAVQVKAKVYNLLGRQVAVLANGRMEAGSHTVHFDGHKLASGVYFLQFEAGPMKHAQKMLLLK